ncbi:Nuclear import protein MOG1 [Nakaseomyces bracarensis]|uniref:Nuclear import protein MOG1 n=1 Tax=Nakaseomyces bracarensis TaxID=273131 RepID=A0ABR4NQ78_9SACH
MIVEITQLLIFGRKKTIQHNIEGMGVTELYGGAITTYIPDGFLDASMLREVPDTQEVFVNSRQDAEAAQAEDGLGTNESVIVDLLQRVEAKDDDSALQVHLEDITALNGGDGFEILRKEKQSDGSITCVLAESAYKWGKKELKETLVICLALKRLVDVETDVVMSINVPLVASELQDNKLPDRVEASYKILLEMTKQFRIVDNSLFA